MKGRYTTKQWKEIIYALVWNAAKHLYTHNQKHTPEWFLSSVRLGKCHHPPNGAGALSPERLGWGVVVQVLPPFPKQCPGCVVHALQELRFLHF